MNKVIIAAFALTFAGYTHANTPNPDTTIVANNENEDKRTPVKLEELPDAVKKALAGDAYAGWTPSAAFWVEGKVSYYEIELSKGDDKSIVKFDKEGQLVK